MGLFLSDYVSIIMAIGTLAIAVIKLYLNQRKVKKDVELSKQYLETLSKLVQSHIKRKESERQLARDKFEHKKLKTYGKALGWIWEHL